MGFVAILLAFAAGIGVWMYRARNAADIAQTAVDLVGDAKSAARRFGYKRKLNANPLDTVDDPRLAVAGILVGMARLDGDLSREQIDRITRECRENFEVDGAEGADMTAFGRWLSQQGEAEEVIRRLARGLRGNLDAERLSSLDTMMQNVARVEGDEVTERQVRAVEMVHRILA